MNVLQPTAPTRRADALDALRGLAILAMVFSGTIRFGILPAWMYHAQVPPPNHQFNPDIPGITWVDLVFPIFLFVMGAAMPLALSHRLTQGWNRWRISAYILKRGFLLATFAIILQHLRPFSINKTPIDLTWWLALAGFVLLFLMFSHFPKESPLKKYELWINVGGWVGAIALISQLQYGGEGFSVNRNDIILMLLADMAVVGAFIWWFTRNNLLLRLGVLGLLIALQLSATTEGWVKWLWGSSPFPWLFQFDYLKYLFIVIPGTIAGDLILQWSQSAPVEKSDPMDADQKQENPNHSRQIQRYILLIISMMLIIGVLLVGLYARWIWQTTLLCIGICSLSWILFNPVYHETDLLLKRLYQWGLYWLALGLCFEPYQGGIHKDPSTYSYYFVTGAIALFLLISFFVLINLFHQQKWLQLLIDNGKNPMIAYVAFGNLLWPILTLTGLEEFIVEHTGTPFLGFLKGILYTLPIALFVSLITRLKIYWKT